MLLFSTRSRFESLLFYRPKWLLTNLCNNLVYESKYVHNMQYIIIIDTFSLSLSFSLPTTKPLIINFKLMLNKYCILGQKVGTHTFSFLKKISRHQTKLHLTLPRNFAWHFFTFLFSFSRISHFHLIYFLN